MEDLVGDLCDQLSLTELEQEEIVMETNSLEDMSNC